MTNGFEQTDKPRRAARSAKAASLIQGATDDVKAYRSAIIHSVSVTEVETLRDALLVVDHGRGGLILDLINVEELEDEEIEQAAKDVGAMEVVDLRGRIIMPGFVDTHAHAPQYAFTGTGMHLPLLKWLEMYTFPCEAKFSDLDFAREIYSKSVRRHLKCGTTTCSYFATLHLDASKLLVDIVREQGQRAYVGKVSMDRNSPEFYVEKTEDGVIAAHDFVKYTLQSEGKKYRVLPGFELPRCTSTGTLTDTDTESPDVSDPEVDSTSEEDAVGDAKVIEEMVVADGGVGEAAGADTSPCEPALVTPVVTPRFVPSCTPHMLKALGDLSNMYNLPVQSHLSESPGEVAWVRELHPECSSYTDVYRTYGLLHERSYFAHCCHCGGDEREMLKAHEAGVAHCPSSNFMLGSGILNVRRLMQKGVKVGLGTDVAGGYSSSVLDAARQAIIASRCISFTERDEEGKPYEALSYMEVFYLATQGGADVLGLGHAIGNFEPGKYFDAIVVDPKIEHGPMDIFDGEQLCNAFEKFLFLGDDRNLEQVFVGGKRVL